MKSPHCWKPMKFWIRNALHHIQYMHTDLDSFQYSTLEAYIYIPGQMCSIIPLCWFFCTTVTFLFWWGFLFIDLLLSCLSLNCSDGFIINSYSLFLYWMCACTCLSLFMSEYFTLLTSLFKMRFWSAHKIYKIKTRLKNFRTIQRRQRQV